MDIFTQTVSRMKEYIYFFLTLLCLWPAFANGDFWKGTVYMISGQAKFVRGKLDKQEGAAYAVYNNTAFTTGWGVLDVKAGYGKKISNRDMMYAAGFIEGVLTGRQIWDQFVNMHSHLFENRKKIEGQVAKWLADQELWNVKMTQEFGNSDPFWRHVGYINAHLDGLYAGYLMVARAEWRQDKFVVRMLNAVGDIIDLKKSFKPGLRKKMNIMTPEQILEVVSQTGHCSVLIKLTPGFEQIYMGHSSWFTYLAMIRIYKYYDFNLDDDNTAAKALSHSSYPGFLHSLDDFYTLSSKMVMLQTTNEVLNASLYDLITPKSLLAWQRVRVANHMAKDGKEWSKILGKHNSGTYNNQYMVIDLKQIHLRKSVDDNALWIVEQIPGLVVANDETAILRAGYWSSYNIPFFEEIYERSGYSQYVATHGVKYSYQLAVRAKIFRRDQDKVETMKDMQHIMRYNDYKNDEYSHNSPCSTICCRGDLYSRPAAFGCYDAKITTFQMALRHECYAIAGPTLGNNLRPFSWTGEFANISHQGMPRTYHFPWVHMRPKFTMG